MVKWKQLLLESLERVLRLIRWMVRPIAVPLIRGFYLSGLRLSCRGRIPASTQFDGPVYLIGTGRLTLGEYCRLGRHVHFETEGDGEIVVGDHVRINAGSFVVSHGKVSIGSDALIGEYVSIRDSNHGLNAGSPMRLQPLDPQPIHIGRDVWIGRGTCILRGVSVGDGAVIGANSVVTNDVGSDCIAVGTPAKAIKNRL
jgi:acetyltransferase-like isoleucine patch superfamily enzyme